MFCSGGSKEVHNYEDLWAFAAECGASSVMLARAAQWNPSVFRPEGAIPVYGVIQEYLKYVCENPTCTMGVAAVFVEHEAVAVITEKV